MKKWSEIKQATLDKLFLTEDEARQQNYLEKFQRLANEGLNFIANGVKPLIKAYNVKVFEDLFVIEGTDFEYDVETNTITYFNKENNLTVIEPAKNVLYYESESVKNVFDGTNLIKTNAVSKTHNRVVMPDDFIVFADMVIYNNKQATEDVVYGGRDEIFLNNAGDYVIYYEALYPEITKEDVINDTNLMVDKSVLNCIPSYVASQVLSQDDVQRSTILKNEFELLLSRLNTDVMYEVKHFQSTGGWY